MQLRRRQFLQTIAATTAGLTLGHGSAFSSTEADQQFSISLAQWSLNDSFFGRDPDNKLDAIDFAVIAKTKCGIDAIEYVNQFFFDKARDSNYLGELNKRANDHGVKQLLIMVDREGRLGDPDSAKRKEAIENHYKWVESAKTLGCHSIRVNAASAGEYKEQIKLAADGLSKLSEFAKGHDLNVIVENHGGLSSNGAWLAEVMKTVNMENCGTLPDFGNFTIDRSKNEVYDRYQGVDELMPFAKAVSAKSYGFDEKGNDVHTDFFKMMDIVVKEHNYHGFVGIEYEGKDMSELDGIVATRKLLERCREQLAG